MSADPAKALRALEDAEAAVAAAQAKVDLAGAAFRAELAANGYRRVVGAFSDNATELYESPDGEELLTLPVLRSQISKENNK